jgi:exopolyphosphatase/guanosine-5'-triphosphate,3'-diphosphate pyrophosphatase
MPAPIAIVDVGSNTIKLLVAAPAPGTPGSIQTLSARTIDARISAGISRGNPVLSEDGITRGLDAITALLADAAPFAPASTVIVATSAVRDALNGGDFCARVQSATGHPMRILTGEEEANAIGRGLTCDPALRELHDFYVFDLGGGSLECLRFQKRRIQQAISLPLGCVRLTERFVADSAAPIHVAALQQVRAHVRDSLASSGFSFDLRAPAQAVFAGGSMTTVRAIFAANAGCPLFDAPARIDTSSIQTLLNRTAALPLPARHLEVPGLPPSRADVFPVALATIEAVADAGHLSAFHHTFHNLRYGIAAEAFG